MSIKPGTKFDTQAEVGCEALTSADSFGNFIGKDSDGVECQFNTAMVIEAK